MSLFGRRDSDTSLSQEDNSNLMFRNYADRDESDNLAHHTEGITDEFFQVSYSIHYRELPNCRAPEEKAVQFDAICDLVTERMRNHVKLLHKMDSNPQYQERFMGRFEQSIAVMLKAIGKLTNKHKPEKKRFDILSYVIENSSDPTIFQAFCEAFQDISSVGNFTTEDLETMSIFEKYLEPFQKLLKTNEWNSTKVLQWAQDLAQIARENPENAHNAVKLMMQGKIDYLDDICSTEEVIQIQEPSSVKSGTIYVQ